MMWTRPPFAMILGAALLAPPPVAAQTAAEAAAQNMQLAVETCLRHYHDEAALPQALATVGFGVTPAEEGVEGLYQIEAPGLWGLVSDTPQNGYCTVQSTLVPLATAEAIGRAVTHRLFPGKVEEGSAERQVGTAPLPCEGLSVFAPRQLISLRYAQAGNSGECINDGTSAVIISM